MDSDPSPLRTGATVRLKSGGPAMSLQALSQNLAYCSWFEGDRLQHGTFALSSLVADEVSPAAAALQEADAAIQHAKQMLDRVDLEVPLDDPDPNPPV